jgi:DNA processing protein
MIADEEKTTTIAVLALCKFGQVEPRLFEALLTKYGNLDRILHTDSGSLMSIPGMTPEIADSVSQAREHFEMAEEYLAGLTSRDIQVVSRFAPEYPQLLFELNDPPPLLYVRGRLPDQNHRIVTVAGSSQATEDGIRITVEVARKLAEADVQIVATLQSGAGASAHLGGRAGAGATFAVLDSGLDHIQPSENLPVAIDIAQEGGVFGEYPPDFEQTADHYIQTNRILAAVSQAVIITEVYQDSRVTLDLLDCCSQIGKLTFLMVDPEPGALVDEVSLDQTNRFGAIPMIGFDKIDEIVRSLV